MPAATRTKAGSVRQVTEPRTAIQCLSRNKAVTGSTGRQYANGVQQNAAKGIGIRLLYVPGIREARKAYKMAKSTACCMVREEVTRIQTPRWQVIFCCCMVRESGSR